MKLDHFIANDVRGYLHFDIEFKDSLTFLIGINGAGKTTALKLLLGLLTPSYKDLNQIEFTTAELVCIVDTDNKRLTISATKNDNLLTLVISKTNEGKTTSQIELLPFDSMGNREFENENFKRLSDNFKSLPVVQKIESLSTPLFLGLDRQTISNRMLGREFRNHIYNRSININFDQNDAVNLALYEVQGLVYDYTRQIAKKQPELSNDFQNKIFTDSFTFHEYKNTDMPNYVDEFKKINKRKDELNEAVDNLKLADEFSDKVNEFFSKIQETLTTFEKNDFQETNEKINSNNVKALLDWIINSYQLNRIDEIVQYSNEYQTKVQKLTEPIVRLQESVNMFLAEGNKKILVTGEGELKIIINTNGKTRANSIFELSSGEKQIIVMFAHLIFCSNKNKHSIFVIDEPELSLHLSWQEIFVDALYKASPETQYVLATHAPAIISKVEREIFCVDLSKKND